MRSVAAMVLVVFALGTNGCSGRSEPPLGPEVGSMVAIETASGTGIEGRLVAIRRSEIVVEGRDGRRTELRRADIARLTTIRQDTAPEVSGAAEPATAAEAPVHRVQPEGKTARASETFTAATSRQVTIPAGTTLALRLQNAVGSDVSRVEDPVRAVLSRPVQVDGIEVLTPGTVVVGIVTDAERSGRVKGRARVAFRFNAIDLPAGGARVPIRTAAVTRVAPASKKTDAATIGGGAAGGALIGGLLGGGDGAAKGAAVGGAAGAGVVLGTRGQEVRVGPDTALSIRLLDPLPVAVRSDR